MHRVLLSTTVTFPNISWDTPGRGYFVALVLHGTTSNARSIMDRFITIRSSKSQKPILSDCSTCNKSGTEINGKSPADILQLAKKNDKEKHDKLVRTKLSELKHESDVVKAIPVVNLSDEEDTSNFDVKSQTNNSIDGHIGNKDPDIIMKGPSDNESLKSSVKLSTLLKNGKFQIRGKTLNRPTYNVCLKIRSEKLKEIVLKSLRVRKDLESILKPPRIYTSSREKRQSFYQELVKQFADMEKKRNTRKGPNYMDLPILKATDFMVMDEASKLEYRSITAQEVNIHLSHKKEHPNLLCNFDRDEYTSFFNGYRNCEVHTQVRPFEVLYYPEFDPITRMKEEVKIAPKDPRFSRLISNYIHFRNDNCLQWCDLFKPKSHDAILQRKIIRESLYSWIKDAFNKLKNVNPRARQKYLKEQRRRNKQDPEMGDFIVDDNDEYDEEDVKAQKDKFIPSLIITGPSGCGKTSSIYATVKEELNGSVFELNSSQPRAKKDINFHLKQIGTTHLVNVETSVNNDKTVILFDDVDLIDDEERDKEFWVGASQLLEYTYRPVIFIARDLSTIPPNVIEESKVIEFSKNSSKLLDCYLKLIALGKGFDIEPEILRSLQRGDLRGSIMQLQLFSSKFDKLDVGLVKIRQESISTEKLASKEKGQDLISLRAGQRSQLNKLKKLNLMRDIKFGIRFIDFTTDTDDVKYRYYDHSYSSQRSSDRYQTVSFYSQLLFPSGSRKRKLLYNGADDYLELNPAASFEYLSDTRIATEVRPFIKSMAEIELDRVHKIKLLKKAGEEIQVRKNRRRFHAKPTDFFDDLNLVQKLHSYR